MDKNVWGEQSRSGWQSGEREEEQNKMEKRTWKLVPSDTNTIENKSPSQIKHNVQKRAKNALKLQLKIRGNAAA